VIVGSANTDLIVRADRIPSPGETVLGGEFRIVSGGKGAKSGRRRRAAGRRRPFRGAYRDRPFRR